MTSQFVSCPDCHVLVLDTAEERREHRAVDRQDRTVLEALRRLVRGAADDAASALQLVRDVQRELEGLDGRVRDAADAPEPELVVVNNWPEDELDDADDEQTSQYADEEQHAAADTADPADEEDDGYDDELEPTTPRRDPLRSYFTGPSAS